jgi:hypothetical protein
VGLWHKIRHKLGTVAPLTTELSSPQSTRSRGHLGTLRTFSIFFNFFQPHRIRSRAQPGYWDPSYRLSDFQALPGISSEVISSE